MGSRHAIIFAIEPESGKCKTRLTPHLTPFQATELYRAFIKDTIDLISVLQLDAVTLAVAAGKDTPFLDDVCPAEWQRAIQSDGDLGKKMSLAAASEFKHGAASVVILGTDSPTLPAVYITEAFSLLRNHDLVFGPAEDGGYYLVGLSKPCPAVFEGIDWSTEMVLEQSLERAAKASFSTALLKEWYDVDNVADLKRALSDLEPKSHTTKALDALALNTLLK